MGGTCSTHGRRDKECILSFSEETQREETTQKAKA
jgi:hypothetical protein